MTTTFCGSGSVKLKAGLNVSTSLTDAHYTELINQAEDLLNVYAKNQGYDFITGYSSLNTNVKLILQDAASSYAAVSAISYDPSGYTTLNEAITIANINWAKYLEGLKLIKEKQYTDFMREA